MTKESFSHSGNELDGLAKATNYYRWIMTYFGPFIRARVIEVAAGFYIGFLRYFDLPGVFTWFLVGRVLRRDTIKPSDVRPYDRCVVPWPSKIERWWEPPFGQSLLAVGRKPNRSV